VAKRLALTSFQCLIFCAWIFGAARSHAETPPRAIDAGESDDDDGAAQVRRARRARASRRWAEAEAAFQEALMAPDADGWPRALRAAVTGELGLCQLELRKYRAAAEHLAISLDNYEELLPALREQLSDALNVAVKHIGRVYVTVTPPDAEVLFDGRRLGLGVEAYEMFVEPGSHVIRAHLHGHEDTLQVFDVAAGGKHRTVMWLPRAPEPVAPVSVAAPREKLPAAPTPATPAMPTMPAPTPPSSRTSLHLAGAVTTGLTAAAGVAFLVWADDAGSEIDMWRDEVLRRGWVEESCRVTASMRGCAELKEAREREYVLRTIGTATLVASGTIGAATLASLIWTHAARNSSKVQVLPCVTGQQAALLIHGVW
jgi:hypothetical protein